MTPPIVCLVTDGSGGSRRGIVPLVADAAAAGVELVQIRERGLDDRALASVVRGAVDAVRGSGTRVLVNDRLDIALAAGADGVHLRADSIAPSRARAVAGRSFLIGRSVHEEDEGAAVEAAGGCDYLLFGTVFPTSSKPAGHPVAGVAALRHLCARVRLPVLAIGGISIDTAAAAATAGAAGVAAIGLFRESSDLSATLAALRRAFDTRS